MLNDYANQLLKITWDPHVVLVLALVLSSTVALIVHRVGRAILIRLSRSAPRTRCVLKSIDRAASYALPLLFAQLVLRSAPDDLNGIGSSRHIAGILLILVLTWLMLRAARGLAEGIVEQYPLNIADNLNARRIHTQTRVLMRTVMTLIVLIGISTVLMTFPSVRTIGASLLASAGVAGLFVGMAARPVLGNLIAGMQIALTQPIRLDDVLIVDGEWGWVEEITGTYVVLRIWDRRRLIVPLQWFIEHPFQNWTRKSADIIGSVFWWVDYGLPLEPVRAEIRRLCEEVPRWWDGDLALLQVTESGPQSMQLRALVTARNSPDCWDLRCHVRAGVIDFIQREYPQFLPRIRAETELSERGADGTPGM
jgi:small-conductance mechanosensitive channel